MRFRLGIVIGLGGGYYRGTRAGRERHEQINQTLRKLRRSEPVEAAAEKARAAVDLGIDRVTEAVGQTLSRGDNGSSGLGDSQEAIDLVVAEEQAFPPMP
jgi:hypothetical protein